MIMLTRKSRTVLQAFSLLEVLLVIAIMILLAALLLPTINQVKERGRQTTCLSNLRQIGMAIALYTEDNSDTLPIGAYNSQSATPTMQWDFSWHNEILPYLQGKSGVLLCPSVGQPSDYRTSYGANPWVITYYASLPEATVLHPSAVVAVAEHQTDDWNCAPWSWQYDPKHTYLTPRHGDRTEVLFLDGRVQTMEPLKLNNIGENWKPN